jgi:HlyD family secretion protein
VQSEHDQAASRLEELRRYEPRLERQIASLKRKRDALQTQLQLLVEESRQLAEAEAKVEAAAARKRLAQAEVQAAQLRLERMIVRAPASGRVLDLLATPGTRVAGWNAEGQHGANAVASLYDPQSLQVRVDVRLEDVPLVQEGQPVTIETASSSQPLRGEVLLATSQANIQKNTLEVKVAVHDPPPTVRPEMLAKATFLAPEQPERSSEESAPPERLLIPRQLVSGEGENAFVWLASAEGRARRQAVTLGGEAAGDLVEVVRGLAPTDKLIVGGRESLDDGDRIRVTGEDPSLGVESLARSL